MYCTSFLTLSFVLVLVEIGSFCVDEKRVRQDSRRMSKRERKGRGEKMIKCKMGQEKKERKRILSVKHEEYDE